MTAPAPAPATARALVKVNESRFVKGWDLVYSKVGKVWCMCRTHARTHAQLLQLLHSGRTTTIHTIPSCNQNRRPFTPSQPIETGVEMYQAHLDQPLFYSCTAR